MKNFLLACSLLITATTFAQIKSPAPSPLATISQKVGLTDLEVTYSRPGKKERKVFGELVPFGEMWRVGANASTKIKFSDDVNIAGNEVPAGEYALYVIPNAENWEIIIHKNITHSGTGGYDAAEDLLRFKTNTKTLRDTWETLTIEFTELTTTGGVLYIAWENTCVHIPIETKSMEMVEKQIKQVLIDGPDAGSYAAGARFYLDNNKDLNQALAWMTKACELRPDAFWYLHTKAKIQGELGKNKEAIATAEKSLEMAKASEDGDFGYVANNEKLIAELKAKPAAKKK
jgi:tetratricopeptide (TPR) repeat protein